MNAWTWAVILALVALCAYFHKDARDARAAEAEWRRLAMDSERRRREGGV